MACLGLSSRYDQGWPERGDNSQDEEMVDVLGGCAGYQCDKVRLSFL